MPGNRCSCGEPSVAFEPSDIPGRCVRLDGLRRAARTLGSQWCSQSRATRQKSGSPKPSGSSGAFGGPHGRGVMSATRSAYPSMKSGLAAVVEGAVDAGVWWPPDRAASPSRPRRRESTARCSRTRTGAGNHRPGMFEAGSVATEPGPRPDARNYHAGLRGSTGGGGVTKNAGRSSPKAPGQLVAFSSSAATSRPRGLRRDWPESTTSMERPCGRR